MITTIQKMYQASDLYGEALVWPLKAYQQTMATAGKVVHFVSGLFAYPFLGFLVLVGMLLKGLEILFTNTIKNHNNGQMDTLRRACSEMMDNDDLSSRTILESYSYENRGVFNFTRANIVDHFRLIGKVVNAFTDEWKKVYIQTQSRFDSGVGQMRVDIQSAEPLYE